MLRGGGHPPRRRKTKQVNLQNNMRQLKITKSITNRESASLDKYLQEIGKEDLITVEEEVDLAQRIKKRGQRGTRETDPREPALRRFGGQAVPESGIVATRPDQRGKPRPDQSRGEIRRDEGIQIHLLRRMVDSPIDPAGTGRAEPYRAAPAEPGGIAQQDQQSVRPLRTGTRAHAVTPRNWPTNWIFRRRK